MEFVHGDVLVKSFPGYNIARLQANLDADLVTSFCNIILHVGINDVNSISPVIILQMYEEMLAMSAGTEFEVIILNLQAAAAAADEIKI